MLRLLITGGNAPARSFSSRRPNGICYEMLSLNTFKVSATYHYKCASIHKTQLWKRENKFPKQSQREPFLLAYRFWIPFGEKETFHNFIFSGKRIASKEEVSNHARRGEFNTEPGSGHQWCS